MIRLLCLIFIASWGYCQENASIEEQVQDFAQMDPYMSDAYIKGPYLMYDCDDNHWVCSGEAEYKRCDGLRNDAIKRKDKNLRCTKFFKFSTIEKCHEKQLEMIGNQAYQRFCLHPEIRKRQVHY